MFTCKEDLCVTGIPGPAVLSEGRRFLVKRAENDRELDGALQLRYRVFKGEQGRLSSCCENLDVDCFDSRSAHLLVIERDSGTVVGTYRLHSGSVAGNGGFYSEQEYRFSGLPENRSGILELGRSCVAPEFRNGAVVALLWAGLAEVCRRCKVEYMLGCASLEHTDSVLARGIYRKLLDLQMVTRSPYAVARRGYHLTAGETAVLDDSAFARALPPLLKGYLRVGAKICGEPAFDRTFGSIDLPVWFDFVNLPEKYIRHFRV
ncbi:MAG: GNAT family N-acetyltransferase [Lentisphaeria bacterium]|nr:GNAT family N-acetyltransferase [Lentisphaeria bacterium]